MTESETKLTCKHCGHQVHSTAGVDPNVPWVHTVTGNSYCDVTDAISVFANMGTPDRTTAAPVRIIEMLRDEMLSRLDPSYDLICVDYRDELDDKAKNAIVSGDSEALWDSTCDWESEARYHGVTYAITELRDEVIRDWENEDDEDLIALSDDFDGSDAEEIVREAMYERESGDWLKQIIRQSGTVLLRIGIEALDEDHAYSFEEVDPAETLSRLTGIDQTDENLSNIRRCLNECSPEYSVLMGYWIVAADLSDLWELDGESDVLITDPHLYLGNPFAGSGFITEDGPLTGTVRVPRAALRTDKGQFGYAVNEIFGFGSISSFESKIVAVDTEASA